MPARAAKICRLPWIWTAGALLMGLSTALFGARAVYLCTEVVERSVRRHLAIQLAFVRRHAPYGHRLRSKPASRSVRIWPSGDRRKR